MSAINKTALAVTPFQFESHEVRAITNEDGEAWFVASDIAEALGYRNAPDLTRILDDDEKGTHIVRTLKGDQELTIMSESGMYHSVLKSRKPEAKKFRKWVTSEVLPTIRKTGKYAVPTEATINPAQQSLIQQAIRARFPDGKDRPYAWSIFNAHFKLGSYKQLPGSKTEEALKYITQTPGHGQIAIEGRTENERMMLDRLLQHSRFLLSFDHRGVLQMREVPMDAFVSNWAELPNHIYETYIGDKNPEKKRIMGNIVKAATDRITDTPRPERMYNPKKNHTT